jgi:hypothetical protein
VQQRQEIQQQRTQQTQTPQQAPAVNRIQQQAQERRQIQDLQAQQRRELRAKGVTRDERLKLRAQQRQQLQDLRAQQQQDRLRVQQPAQAGQQPPQADRLRPQLAGQSKQDRVQIREQARKLRAERREQRLKQVQTSHQQLQRRDRAAQITRQQALQGRFAAQLQNRADARSARAAFILSRQAWRAGQRAAFVAWLGPVFYPYVYADIFDYTFFPWGYDPAYWAYAYDDFFESVFWVYDGPRYDVAYGPPPFINDTVGMAPPRGPSRPPRQQLLQQVCEPDKGVTAWPFEQIERAVRPNAEQKALLDEVRKAAAEAADTFKASCRTDFAETSPGRVQAIINRLEATIEAIGIVRPQLEAFYSSLSDEQKSRFNLMGPTIGQDEARAMRNRTQAQQSKTCVEPKPGLTDFPIQQIDAAVRPNAEQRTALDKLDIAVAQAVDTLQSACPNVIAQTPIGRLEAMEKRLEAMLDAAETVQPALEEFYASLSNEQKARFNTLGRQAQRSN